MRGLARIPMFVLLIGVGGLGMYLPAAHALALRNYPVSRDFFYSGTLFVALAALLALATAANRPGKAQRDSLLTMLAAFTLLPLVLAVPLREAVPGLSLYGAWWEMVSALTTTGATLLAPAEVAPSVHLWRALVGWSGGFLMLVMAVAVLAPMRLGGFEMLHLPTAEGGDGAAMPVSVRGAAPNVRILHFAGKLAPVYAALTLALWVGLLVAGDPVLVALSHAMSTLSTSGITPLERFGQAPSGIAGEVLIVLFMVPALSRRLWPGGGELRASERLLRDPELRLAAALLVLVPVLLFVRHWLGALDAQLPAEPAHIALALWGGLFSVMSFLTTTGFESSGWAAAQLWSGLQTPGLLLAGLAIVGGGVATTAGGVKLLRIYALMRHGEREMELLVHPSSVGGGGIVARRLRRGGAHLAWVFFMLFAMSIAVVMMAVSLAGVGFEPATILTIAALSNTGPLAAVSGLGPQTWSALEPAAQAVLAAAMVLGRLETLALIALLNPEFWQR